jgi:hypothetical protein
MDPDVACRFHQPLDGPATTTADVEDDRTGHDLDAGERPGRQAGMAAIHDPEKEPARKPGRPAELAEEGDGGGSSQPEQREQPERGRHEGIT